MSLQDINPKIIRQLRKVISVYNHKLKRKFILAGERKGEKLSWKMVYPFLALQTILNLHTFILIVLLSPSPHFSFFLFFSLYSSSTCGPTPKCSDLKDLKMKAEEFSSHSKGTTRLLQYESSFRCAFSPKTTEILQG